MPARRSSIPERSSALVLAAALLAGCQDAPEDQAPADAGAPRDASAALPPEPPPSPLTRISEAPAGRGLLSLESLAAALPQGRGDSDPRYLDLRRALAAGAPLWRRPESLGGEVVFGPPRSIDEGGGALLRLDAALVRGDAAAARPEMVALDRALRLFQNEARRLPPAPAVIAHALSLAAYDLGALALESIQGVPESSAAVLADLRGTLDFIETAAEALAQGNAGAEAALGATKEIARPLRARLDAARTADDLDDRARFVLATGRLGVALRRLAAAAGQPVRVPYRARFPTASTDADEPISALTLPAARSRPRKDGEKEAAFAALGRKLFSDKRLSKNNARSCATCHVPEKGFADGLPRPPSLDPAVTLRHTPTLLYVPLHAAQLWDGGALSPERQALGVIHARAEMGLEPGELVSTLESAADLRALFQALPKPGVTAENVARALAAFESEAFVPGDAPIDVFARGDETALSPLHRRGLDVFAGKGRCARCHIPPFFGGSRPTDFAVPVFAALGVPDKPGGHTLDPDRGRGVVTSRAADEGAFKTPTARDVSRTAPYFHNGAFRTLEEVIDFYDKGGGKALGIPLPNQDPDVRPLGLSADDKRALLAFLREALLDKTPPDKLIAPR